MWYIRICELCVRMKKKERWISTENEVMQRTETQTENEHSHAHSHVDSCLVSSSYSQFQHESILGLWNKPYLSTQKNSELCVGLCDFLRIIKYGPPQHQLFTSSFPIINKFTTIKYYFPSPCFHTFHISFKLK